MSKDIDLQEARLRTASRPIDPLFLERWSPRTFDASPIAHEDLLTLFEAARWAPSAYNYQPWRFLFAVRDDDNWGLFLHSLLPFNQAWAQHASALVFLVSDRLIDRGKSPEPTESCTASFDAGAAWASLAFQAVRLGLHTRGMAGFDHDYARKALSIPRRFRIEAAIAVGRKTQSASASEELRPGEVPTSRRALSEIVFVGRFGNAIVD